MELYCSLKLTLKALLQLLFAGSHSLQTDGHLCPAVRTLITSHLTPPPPIAPSPPPAPPPQDSEFTTKQITGSRGGGAARIPTIPALVFRCFPPAARLDFTTSSRLVSPRSDVAWSGLTPAGDRGAQPPAAVLFVS